jgi:hypothetical protein
VPRRSSEVKLGFARIKFADGSFAPAAPDFNESLEASLEAGKAVVRYERLWRLTRHTTQDEWIFGRLGFEPAGATDAVGVWDEEAKDYRRINPGQLVRYAIDLEARRVAFELRSAVVRPGTFQGNFQALLNLGAVHHWRVALEGVSQPPWEEWRESISRLTSLTIRMKRPNPRYPGELVEHMFEDAKLAAATLGAKGDNIDMEDSELLSQAFALAQDYGSISAKGVVGPEATKDEWRSAEEGRVEQERVYRDPDTQDIPQEEFKRALLERREDE